MGFSSEQLKYIYNSRMRNLLSKIDRDKKEKLQKEADEKLKQQEFWGKLNLTAGLMNAGKDVRDFIVSEMRDIRFGEDLNILGKPVPQRKWDFKTKTERDWLPEGLLPGGKEAKLGKIGGAIKDYVLPLEKTEGYKEFKRKEELDIARSTVPIDVDDEFYIPGQDQTKKLSGLDYEAEDFDPSRQGVPELPDIGRKGPVPELAGPGGAPIIPEAEAPSVDPGSLIGKGFEAGQTALQLTNIGRTLTSEEATDADKAVASVQGSKMLADIAAKKAKKEGVQALGKTVGTAASGALGAYTAVTEAKEAGEAWKEKDYDEAILHGMNSASGTAQTAGLGMMATGVGAPLGAILYGVGKAGQVISSVALFLEDLFGGGDGKPAATEKPKFDMGRYFDRIGRR